MVNTGNIASKDIGWEEALKEFFWLLIKSPIALVSFGMSFFFGYGMSFVLFDYRMSSVKKSHFPYHIGFGMCYSIVVFIIVNWTSLSYKITYDQICERIPFTLLVSGAIAFIVMLIGAIWREKVDPYSKKEIK